MTTSGVVQSGFLVVVRAVIGGDHIGSTATVGPFEILALLPVTCAGPYLDTVISVLKHQRLHGSRLDTGEKDACEKGGESELAAWY